MIGEWLWSIIEDAGVGFPSCLACLARRLFGSPKGLTNAAAMHSLANFVSPCKCKASCVSCIALPARHVLVSRLLASPTEATGHVVGALSSLFCRQLKQVQPKKRCSRGAPNVMRIPRLRTYR